MDGEINSIDFSAGSPSCGPSTPEKGFGVDAHIDTLQRVLLEGVDLRRQLGNGHVDLPRLRKGRVQVPFLAMWVPPYYRGADAVRRTLDFFDTLSSVLDLAQDEVELPTNYADLERICRKGKIAPIVSIEGGHQIAGDLAVLRMFYRLGARSMTLTHSRSHDWADSSTDSPRHGGLAPFGESVIDEMNRLGMIVDVSHASDQTFFGALRVTRKPVIASHSGCRSIVGVPRNLSDKMLRALADNGGVICINFHSPHLHPQDALQAAQHPEGEEVPPDLSGTVLDEWAKQQHLEMMMRRTSGIATIEDVVTHIDHAVRLAGIESVGIGSDYDGGILPPRGLEDVSARMSLASALSARGFSEDAIRKIMSDNVLRVLRQVLRA
jgi:membrane dipeptidase